MMPGPYHNLLLPPGKLVCEGTFFSFVEKEERRENNDMGPFGSLLLTGCRCCTKCQITHARKKLMHEMDKLCGAHGVLFMHGICARLCTKDYMQQRQDLYKRWLPERVPATAPYGKNLRRCSMFQELLTGMPSSVSRRTAPGLVTRLTR